MVLETDLLHADEESICHINMSAYSNLENDSLPISYHNDLSIKMSVQDILSVIEVNPPHVELNEDHVFIDSFIDESVSINHISPSIIENDLFKYGDFPAAPTTIVDEMKFENSSFDSKIHLKRPEATFLQIRYWVCTVFEKNDTK